MPEYRVNCDSNGLPISVIVPRYAFKFAAVNANTLASLSESYLWFSRPSEFNDIFELPTKVSASLTDPQCRAYLRANINHHWPKFGITPPTGDALDATIDQLLASNPELLTEMFRILQNARRDLIRIHCLSMRYDDPLMWAHYAASFSGVCLVYDFPQLAQAGPWFALQVKYVHVAPSYDPIEQSLRQLAAPSPYDNFAANVEHDQLQFGIKLDTWAHEQELRLCTLQPHPKHHHIRSALLGVVLGPRISAEAERLVRKAAAVEREAVTVETLTVNSDKNILLVNGLENYDVELRVSGVRNFARELRHGGTEQ